MRDIYLTAEAAARLEGISGRGLTKRIQRGQYPEWAIKKVSREVGGYYYTICLDALSAEAQSFYSQTPAEVAAPEEIKKERKRRADAGKTKADENLIMRCAAKINMTRKASQNFERNYGYKEVYNNTFIPASKEAGTPVISYRQFINLTTPFIDKTLQQFNNLGESKWKSQKQMVLTNDYSVYEPMQFLLNDHTQADVVCVHNGRLLRPWCAFHLSAGDRMLSYPTVVERPDSYSLADNLANFVYRYGLSNKETLYKSDNGKAQKGKLMTKEGRFEDVTYEAFDIEEKHMLALRRMGLAAYSEQGMIQNLGMIEAETGSYLGRAKVIERNFGIGGTMEWFKDRPEYTGRNYTEKPEGLEKVIKKGIVWNSEEMIDYMISRVDVYNNRKHEGIKKERKGMFAIPHTYGLDLEFFQTNAKILQAFKGLIPDSISEVHRIFNDPLFAKDELHTELYSPMWCRKVHELCGWQSRAIPSKESLAMLIMPFEERTVHPYGINIRNHTYISFKLQNLIGQKVICRYSPSNIIRIKELSGKERLFIEEIYVFKKVNNGGRITEEFVCIAEPHHDTVTGLKPEGYAKAFLNERHGQLRELKTAAKITSRIAAQAETEQAVGTPVIQLNSFREEAAKQLTAARAVKKEQQEVDKIKDEEFAEKASLIYGKKVSIEE